MAIRANHVRGHHNELGCYFKCEGNLLEDGEQWRPIPCFPPKNYFACQARVEIEASAIVQCTGYGGLK